MDGASGLVLLRWPKGSASFGPGSPEAWLEFRVGIAVKRKSPTAELGQGECPAPSSLLKTDLGVISTSDIVSPSKTRCERDQVQPPRKRDFQELGRDGQLSSLQGPWCV